MSNARRIFEGSGAVFVGMASARLLSIIGLPILTPLLGPTAYGIAALVGTVIAITSVISLAGIDLAYARFYFDKDISQSSVEHFCWLFSLSSALLVGCTAAIFWLCYSPDWAPRSLNLSLYLVFANIVAVMATMAQTKARINVRYRKLAIVAFIAAVLGLFSSVLTARYWSADSWALLLGSLVFSTTIVLLLGGPQLILRRASPALSFRQQGEVLKLGAAGSLTAPVYWVLSSADKWFLARFADFNAIGVYSLAVSVGGVGLMFNAAVNTVWFPEAIRIFNGGSRPPLDELGRLWARVITAIAIAWFAVAIAGGDVLRLLASEEFHDGAKAIPIIAAAGFFYGAASIANTQLLLAKRMRYSAFWWLIGGITCMPLYFFFISKFSFVGAAVAQCIAYAVIAAGILAVAQKQIRFHIPWVRLIGALSFIAVAACFAASSWAAKPFYSLAIKVPYGLVVFAITLAIIAPEWGRRICAAIKRT